MRSNYLDHLAVVLRCQCLSDLRYRVITDREAHMLLEEGLDYPAAQYLEAAHYVLGQALPASLTAAEIRARIVKHMNA